VIDHLGLEVRDYLHSKDFYPAALAPLGIDLMTEAASARPARPAHALPPRLPRRVRARPDGNNVEAVHHG
jgi:hypothetical protein